MLEKINDSVYILDNQFVRGYLILGDREAVVLDTGMDIPDLLEKCREVTDLPLRLVITHGDMDHCGGNRFFEEVSLHPAEMVNYKAIEGQRYRFLKDGEILDLGGRELEVIYTPGHTPGAISLLDRQSRLLFTGDDIQTRSNIFMHGPMRNLYSYLDSLKKVEARKEEFDHCVSCHGDVLVEKDIIGKLIEGTEKILTEELPYQPMEFRGKKIRRYDLGFVQIDTDEKS